MVSDYIQPELCIEKDIANIVSGVWNHKKLSTTEVNSMHYKVVEQQVL